MESHPSPSSSSDVDEDDHDHEHAHGKRRRYSPMPVVSAGAAVVSCHDEPSSSHCNDPAAAPQLELSRLQAQLVEREQQLEQQRSEAETFLRELQESVMCPVCLSIPRQPPVPCCQNGHVICIKCKERVEVCPTCRVTMTNCVSQVAATIIQRIQHPCDFRDAGCDTRCDINSISAHEDSCRYRVVRCPHWACDEQISVTHLTSHVLAQGDNGDSGCGDNYMNKPLPYQVEKQDKQWYFYVQMEGSAAECERFETKVSVCKFPNSERHSISYNGKVCPIDIKGADEVDASGSGLNVRDAVMEKIFVVDSSSGAGGVGGVAGGGASSSSAEKEEGEVGEGEAGEGERYKFWVKVDVFEVTD